MDKTEKEMDKTKFKMDKKEIEIDKTETKMDRIEIEKDKTDRNGQIRLNIVHQKSFLDRNNRL